MHEESGMRDVRPCHSRCRVYLCLFTSCLCKLPSLRLLLWPRIVMVKGREWNGDGSEDDSMMD
jgi:hypothetical protein